MAEPRTPANAPVIPTGYTFGTITDKISAIVLTRRTSIGWWLGFLVSFGIMNVMLLSVAYLLAKGTGIWGVNVPVGWGFAIVNFVWWIGIGHAGTLISAILLLLKQPWRTSINRFAEAMTLFAVACAGIFPLIHTGRPWLAAYWLFPYPNTMGLWPQFRSPLIWDVFAVSTYATVSALFWFVGLIPDLATLRDRTTSRSGRFVYGLLAMGWRGSAAHWHRYETAYLLLAGLATPLVVSVHTVVSFDFAIAIVPGWHTTIFPPYFVAGAIYSGFAMVVTLAIPIRAIYGLEDFITSRHLQNMAKVMLVTGLIVAYGYGTEMFIAWYSADKFEIFVPWNRMTGPYGIAYWALILCNVGIPQALWFRRVRSNTIALFVIAIIVNIGMWLERFVIVVTSLHRDFLPSSWGNYQPT
ncbi:MAG: NrfD/PsrC family molybdoenzyme membrane anchor subunit, partial [Acidobacteriota bacterium]